jgi:formyl-CoA transferase
VDQPIIVAVGNDRQFEKLAAILGHPEWASDERFDSNAARVANRSDLVPLIAAIVATKPAAVWLPLLEEAGIPAGPINSVRQALADPQAVHRGMRIEAGGTPMVGCPIRLDSERQDAPLPPPALGEHGDALGEWLDAETLADLRRRGIVG